MSIEVQEYRSIVRNEGNDKSLYWLGIILYNNFQLLINIKYGELSFSLMTFQIPVMFYQVEP